MYEAMRATLTGAIAVLRERVPPTFEKQVRDFLAVHDKGGQPCPRCGTRITEVKAGGFITSYCRGCQR
jgi:formamidopyrimidine-DNA glycosylase